MPPIAAFAAYKNMMTKKNATKKDSLGKAKKSKVNVNPQKQVSKKNKTKTKRFIIKDDVYGTDEDGLTYEEFIEKGLSLSQIGDHVDEGNKIAESKDKKIQEEAKSSNKRNYNMETSQKINQKQNKEKQIVPKMNAAIKYKNKKYSEENSKSNITPTKPQQSSTNNQQTIKKPKRKGSETQENTIERESRIPLENIYKTSSITIGENYFRWLINPISLENFFGNFWEKNTLLVKRIKTDFYSMLISFKSIDQMLLDHHVEFTKNIDVTTYENGIRETHNPEGRALPPAVWDFYRDGCSIRLLNPQTFLKPLHELCATLQEYFHCLVGANVYLTPPNSQGFAPHYDDIEAFVLQIEGRKHWKVYSPRSPSEVLPRVSSANFTQDEIGEPILEQTLEPGDMLYFPRGAIHQAFTEPGYHSLHITLSVYQKQSYADLLEKLLPMLLKNAIDNNVKLRRGLPLNIWQNAGLIYSECDNSERSDLHGMIKNTLRDCLQSVQLNEIIDSAVDELAKKFQHEALPPYISQAEKQKTIFGLRTEPNDCGDCKPKCPIDIRTNVRLLRANILRLVAEEEQFRIYYYLDNSKEYCEYEPNFFEIDPTLVGCVEVLIKSYPQYVSVSQLPLKDDESKLDLAICLWKRGLLMTEKPFS